jgi:plastocyanin
MPANVKGRSLVSARTRFAVGALFALLALTLTVSGTSGSWRASAEAAMDGPTVTLKGTAYVPAAVSVNAGATVTWAWADGDMPHNVAGLGFTSPVQTTGTFSHRFDAPGTYDYKCTLHPGMAGTVTVR